MDTKLAISLIISVISFSIYEKTPEPVLIESDMVNGTRVINAK